jgi:hypothetical protein
MNGSAMGNVEIRLDLTNGMRIAALANVADDSRTMLINGLAQARTNGWSVISALPFTLYRSPFLCERLARLRGWEAD